MHKILVTGSLAYDHIMYHDGIFHEVVLPEHLHNLNVCFLIKEKNTHFGGTGGNIAYNLRLLGEEVVLVGVAGNDFENYQDWLKKNQINTQHIRIIDDTSTAAAFITSDKKGNQITHFYSGAMGKTPKIDLKHYSKEISFAIIAPDNTQRMMNFVNQCTKLKIPYIFDPGQSIPTLEKNELHEAIKNGMCLIVNEYELELILDKLKITKKTLFEFTKLLIVTRGEKGSTIETSDHKEEIESVQPQKVLDPTGCGDAYRAGIIKGLKERFSKQKMGRIAALMGTYSVEKQGTQNHFFHLEEFEKRYRKNFHEEIRLKSRSNPSRD